MLRRTFRFLMLWLFVVLQAMVPFIHAHAGAASPHHGGPLHVHQTVVQADAAWHVVAADDHGSALAVAAGLPARKASPAVAASPHAGTAPAQLGRASPPLRLDSPPLPRLTRGSPPPRLLPFALAPPAA